jgi:hypothetical protein
MGVQRSSALVCAWLALGTVDRMAMVSSAMLRRIVAGLQYDLMKGAGGVLPSPARDEVVRAAPKALEGSCLAQSKGVASPRRGHARSAFWGSVNQLADGVRRRTVSSSPRSTRDESKAETRRLHFRESGTCSDLRRGSGRHVTHGTWSKRRGQKPSNRKHYTARGPSIPASRASPRRIPRVFPDQSTQPVWRRRGGRVHETRPCVARLA